MSELEQNQEIHDPPHPTSTIVSGYEKSWAVVIGIDEYQNVSRLDNAVNDAKKLAELLRKIGFDEIIEIYDNDASRGSILSNFLDEDKLPSKVGKNDRIVVFFAGHGISVINKGDNTESGYIIPHDGIAEKWSTCIEFADLVQKTVKKLPAKHILFLMDCCFSGLAAITVRSVMHSDSTKKSKDVFVDSCTRNRAVQIIVAGQTDEAVLDGSIFSGHSPFTGAIIYGIESNDADLNEDGILTATELSSYLDTTVSHAANIYGHKQKPFMNRLVGDGGGDFIIVIPNSDMGLEAEDSTENEQEFDEFLNEQREDYDIFGTDYSPSEVLKKVDKTRYNIMLKDWLKPEVSEDSKNIERDNNVD